MGQYFLKEGEVLLIGRERLTSGFYAANSGPLVLVYTNGREVSYTTTWGPNAIGLTRTVVQGLRPIPREEITPEIRSWLGTASFGNSRGLAALARQIRLG